METAPPSTAPVVVFGALDIETKVLEAALTHTHTHRAGTFVYTAGEYLGRHVVVGRSGMGSANAAAACALAIDRFNPSYIISQGTAGAHNPALHQGNIVIGTKVRNIHFISTAQREAGEGINTNTWDYIGPRNVLDTNLNPENTIAADPHLLTAALRLNFAEAQVDAGILGSGDVWNRELDRIRFFHEQLGTSCEDMESFAIAQICQQFQVPCLCLRVISNSEYHHEEEFDPATAAIPQRFVLQLLDEK